MFIVLPSGTHILVYTRISSACCTYRCPTFYKQPVNVHKLFNAVQQFGGYDAVCACGQLASLLINSFQPKDICMYRQPSTAP